MCQAQGSVGYDIGDEPPTPLWGANGWTAASFAALQKKVSRFGRKDRRAVLHDDLHSSTSRSYQSGEEVGFSVRVCGDGDNEGRRFSIDDGDQGESEGGVGSQDENDGVASLRGLLRRSLPVERAHQEAEVEAGELSQIR